MIGAITWWMLEDSGNAWQGGAQAASEGEAGLQQQQQPSSSSQGPGTPSPSDASNGKSKAPEQNGRRDLNLTDEEARQLLDAEEEKRKQRRRQKKGRIRELEEVSESNTPLEPDCQLWYLLCTVIEFPLIDVTGAVKQGCWLGLSSYCKWELGHKRCHY